MSDEVLESYVRQYIEAQPVEEITFAWQGGEPTLLGVGFFQKVVALQKKYANGRKIENAFQTNGTLIDDEWGAFLSENNFLVGISIDGPRNLHDAYRVDRKQRPTFDRVMCGLEYIKKHRVEFNTLTVVNRLNAKKPLEVYRFLRGIGSRFLQFIPLVERKSDRTGRELGLKLATPPHLGSEPEKEIDSGSPVTPWSVRPGDYGEFLIQIFYRWVRKDVGRYYVQIFDLALSQWLGMESSLCVFKKKCGRAMALEHDGSLYSCDHYVYPKYFLGNIQKQSLVDIVDSPEQLRFGEDKWDRLPQYCRRCEVRFACNGECPKHRFMTTPDGEDGLNYLCPSFKRFFNYIDPYMSVMAELYKAGRPPAEIMNLIAQKKLPFK